MKHLWLIALAIASLTACTVFDFQQQSSGTTPEKSQLQTRQFQTREFDTNDTKLILKAVLNVLQDDGFVVKNAVSDLGLLTATKEIDMNQSTSNSDADFWSALFESMARNNNNRNSRQEQQPSKKFKIIESSINVSEMGSRSKVRANFQAKIVDSNGNTLEVSVVEDPKFYQDFFMKVDKGVFIQKQGL